MPINPSLILLQSLTSWYLLCLVCHSPTLCILIHTKSYRNSKQLVNGNSLCYTFFPWHIKCNSQFPTAGYSIPQAETLVTVLNKSLQSSLAAIEASQLSRQELVSWVDILVLSSYLFVLTVCKCSVHGSDLQVPLVHYRIYWNWS